MPIDLEAVDFGEFFEGAIPELELTEEEQAFTPTRSNIGLSSRKATRLMRLLREKARRDIEPLRMYKPMPTQAEFHACASRDRIAVGSNRSGKTTVCAVEFARAVTRQDPHGKYPTQGKALVVGENTRHVSVVMFEKLFRAGVFYIIRDLEDGRWRIYNPWTDKHRIEDRKPAPPLIPSRFIKGGWAGIAWENKKERVPRLIPLTTGWEITFAPSSGDPIQGIVWDLAWFDEEIHNESWYGETARGLTDSDGLFMWSATPTTGSESLFLINQRADDEERDPSIPYKTAKKFFFDIHSNEYLTDQQREEFKSKINSQEEYEIRIGGQFVLQGTKFFPEFDERTHALEYFQIPDAWSKIIVVDPGHAVCAVLMGAISPPDESFEEGVVDDKVDEWHYGGRLFLFDELYIRHCNADKFAQEIKKKLNGVPIQNMLIDWSAGRQTQIAAGETVVEAYEKALKRVGIRCEATGYQFTPGYMDFDGGVESVRDYMNIGRDGHPRILVMKDKLPNFMWELKRYRKKRNKTTGMVENKPVGRDDHLMDCMRYMCAFRPKWIKPPMQGSEGSYAYRAFKMKQDKKSKTKGPRGYINLGPASESTYQNR